MRGQGPTHGTASTYRSTKYRCRCIECTKANTLYQMRLRGREPKRHGVYTSYVNYGCRCEPCKVAGAERNKAYYEEQKRLAAKRRAVLG